MDTVLLENLLNNTPNLTSRTIGRNVYLDHFPKIVKGKNNLKELHLIGNNLNNIPNDIVNLSALEIFECSGNNIEKLPDNFSELIHLNALTLRGNKITVFPVDVLKLKNLQTLIISKGISTLPENIDELSQLQKIGLTNANISTLPKSFSKLKDLKDIDLSNNQFTAFPSPLLKLKQVKVLSLNENPISKESLEKSLKGIKFENAIMYIPITEEECSSIKNTYPKINFIPKWVPPAVK